MTTRSLSLSGLDDADLDDVMCASARFVDDLRRARIVVTGATGWFGTWLLDALVAMNRVAGLELGIVAVTRDPAAFARRHPALAGATEITWIAADVRDAHLEFGRGVTHIIHAAAETSAISGAARPDALFETIVGGTANVLRVASRVRDVKCLLVSSGAVYGHQPADLARITEEYGGGPDPLDAGNAYAEGKRAAEQLAAIHHRMHGLHVTIARCFAFVGPHMPLDAHFAIGNFIGDSLAGAPLRIHGDGRPLRSYLYMSDLVVWLLAILVDGRPGRAYNVGGDEALSILDLAKRCAAIGGVSFHVEGRSGNARNYVPDTQRAHRELGLLARVSLDGAIRRTMAWAARAIASPETAVAVQ
jgi:dTDP-glucose 4,6-dehydratase